MHTPQARLQQSTPDRHRRPTWGNALFPSCRNSCIGCCGNGFTCICYIPLRWPFLHFAPCWSKQISRSATQAVFANRATYRHVKHLVSVIGHVRRCFRGGPSKVVPTARILSFARSPRALVVPKPESALVYSSIATYTLHVQGWSAMTFVSFVFVQHGVVLPK